LIKIDKSKQSETKIIISWKHTIPIWSLDPQVSICSQTRLFTKMQIIEITPCKKYRAIERFNWDYKKSSVQEHIDDIIKNPITNEDFKKSVHEYKDIINKIWDNHVILRKSNRDCTPYRYDELFTFNAPITQQIKTECVTMFYSLNYLKSHEGDEHNTVPPFIVDDSQDLSTAYIDNEEDLSWSFLRKR